MFLQQATSVKIDNLDIHTIYKGEQQVWPATTTATVEPDVLKTPFWIMNIDTADFEYSIWYVNDPPNYNHSLWYSDDMTNWTLVTPYQMVTLAPGAKRWFIGYLPSYTNAFLRNATGGVQNNGKIQLGGNYKSMTMNTIEEWNEIVNQRPFELLQSSNEYIMASKFTNTKCIHYAHTMYVPYTFYIVQRIHGGFQGCTNLKTGPIFTNPAQNEQYRNWKLPWLEKCFYGCTSLTDVHLADYNMYGYTFQQNLWNQMFEGCTSLRKPPQILQPLTEKYPYNVEYLIYKPFDRIFRNCTNLEETLDLVFSDTFYLDPVNQMPLMYENCTSLTTATFRNVGSIVENPVFNMYNGCTGIRELHFEIKHDINFGAGSFQRMSPDVTLYKPVGYTYTGYPSTWTVVEVDM